MTANYEQALSGAGFVQHGSAWVGKVNGVLVRVIEGNQTDSTCTISVGFADAENKGKLIEVLDRIKADGKIDDYTLDSAAFSATYRFTEDAAQLPAVVGELAAAFNNLHLKNACEGCGKPEPMGAFRVGQKTVVMCEDCMKSAAAEVVRVNNRPNNYLMGFAGSLVGALIGSIAWILIGALGFYASIAGFAIAFCALFGYKFCQAKLSKIGVGINILNIVAGLLFAEYVGVFIMFKKEFPELSVLRFLQVTPELLRDGDFLRGILPNVGLGLLFAMLGSYRIIKNSYDEGKQVVNVEMARLL